MKNYVRPEAFCSKEINGFFPAAVVAIGGPAVAKALAAGMAVGAGVAMARGERFDLKRLDVFESLTIVEA